MASPANAAGRPKGDNVGVWHGIFLKFVLERGNQGWGARENIIGPNHSKVAASSGFETFEVVGKGRGDVQRKGVERGAKGWDGAWQAIRVSC